MDKIIEITNLTKLYKNGRGIKDINLEIQKGEIFGFLGPNGAGKTTAMKIMTGLMKADRGTVRLFGYNIEENFELAMSKVGAIIETAEVYPYLSAYENLKQCSRYYGNIDESRIDEVLEICDIKKYKKEKAKSFSLGMKQRLGIACSILHRPELLILDEPLNGLDVEGMVEMRKLFKRLKEQEQTTIFISSHLVHDVELTADKVGIIFNGKMKAVDYMSNILSRHESLEDYFISEVDENEQV